MYQYACVLRADPCAYCGGRMADVEHIDALGLDGDDVWDNLTASCTACNSRKGASALLLFLAEV